MPQILGSRYWVGICCLEKLVLKVPSTLGHGACMLSTKEGRHMNKRIPISSAQKKPVLLLNLRWFIPCLKYGREES